MTQADIDWQRIMGDIQFQEGQPLLSESQQFDIALPTQPSGSDVPNWDEMEVFPGTLPLEVQQQQLRQHQEQMQQQQQQMQQQEQQQQQQMQQEQQQQQQQQQQQMQQQRQRAGVGRGGRGKSRGRGVNKPARGRAGKSHAIPKLASTPASPQQAQQQQQQNAPIEIPLSQPPQSSMMEETPSFINLRPIAKKEPDVKIKLNDSYKIYTTMLELATKEEAMKKAFPVVYIERQPRSSSSSTFRFNFPLRLAPTFLEAMRRLDNGGGFRKLPLAVDQYPKDTDGYFVLPCAKTNFSRTCYGIEQFTLQVREETFLTNNGEGSYEALVFTCKSEKKRPFNICVPIQLFYPVYASLTYICQKSAM